MLREIFRTEPIPYMKRGSPLEPGYLLGVQYHPNKEPYLETLNWINGMHVGHTLKDVCPAGPSSIYVWTINSANWWPSWSSGYYKFDGKSGKFIRRMAVINSSLGVLMAMNDVNTSRQSIPWATHLYGNILYKISLGKTAQELVGEETEPVDTWGIVPEGEEVNGILGPSAGIPSVGSMARSSAITSGRWMTRKTCFSTFRLALSACSNGARENFSTRHNCPISASPSA